MCSYCVVCSYYEVYGIGIIFLDKLVIEVPPVKINRKELIPEARLSVQVLGIGIVDGEPVRCVSGQAYGSGSKHSVRRNLAVRIYASRQYRASFLVRRS